MYDTGSRERVPLTGPLVDGLPDTFPRVPIAHPPVLAVIATLLVQRCC